MNIALAIVQMVVQYGIPTALQIVQLWSKQAPDNVELKEWNALLTTLSKTYDDYVPKEKPAAGPPSL